MDVELHRQGGFVYVVIDNFFDSTEYALVRQEILDVRRFAGGPGTTKSAADEQGNFQKTGQGVFLDALYKSDRSKSDILASFRKLFDPGLASGLAEHDASFMHLRNANTDCTLLNYYWNNQYYRPHRDNCALTAVWFDVFGKVEGGRFIFPEYEIAVELKSNRLVLFHGCIQHGANEVEAEPDAFRVSIAKFINYK